jgi:SAM-dependent methyltransferase
MVLVGMKADQMTLTAPDSARLEREKDFHNKRFAEEGRQAQEKYYAAIADGALRFTGMVNAAAQGKDIVELGCAVGQTLDDVLDFKTGLGVDISDEAIRQASARTRAGMSFYCGDAQNLPIPDSSVDLVFGRGILHHLDTELCLAECKRVLRPGGKVLFWEPLGRNPIFNVYRALTPSARTVDEHPLLDVDFEIARRFFPDTTMEPYGLTTLVASFLPYKAQQATRKALRPVDKAIFSIPFGDQLAWYCIMTCTKV